MPSDWAKRGVFPYWLEGVGGRRDSKEEDFFLDVMPSSHTHLDHGGQQAAQKGVWEFKSLFISHVRCPVLADCSSVGGFLLFFLW